MLPASDGGAVRRGSTGSSAAFFLIRGPLLYGAAHGVGPARKFFVHPLSDCGGVLLESGCIYNFTGLSRRNRRFCSTIEIPKFLVFRFSGTLHRLEYASSNQGVRGSNPFGRT